MPSKASEQTQPAEQGGSEALRAMWSDFRRDFRRCWETASGERAHGLEEAGVEGRAGMQTDGGDSCPTTSWLGGNAVPPAPGIIWPDAGLVHGTHGPCGQRDAALMLDESQHPLTRTWVCGGSFQGLQEEQPGLFRREQRRLSGKGLVPPLGSPLSSQHPAFTQQVCRAAHWLQAVLLRPHGQTWSQSGLCQPWSPRGERAASGSCY